MLSEVHRAAVGQLDNVDWSIVCKAVGVSESEERISALESRNIGLCDIVMMLAPRPDPASTHVVEVLIGRPISRYPAGPAIGDLPVRQPGKDGALPPKEVVPPSGRTVKFVGENPHRNGSSRWFRFKKLVIGKRESELGLAPRYITEYMSMGLLRWAEE